MRRGPRCLDEFPCRSCGPETARPHWLCSACRIVQLNGRSSSADFLHDDPDAVQQISGGAAMWPESFLEPGTFFRNGSLHAEAAPRLTAWAGASDCEARAVVQRARECTDHS
jgi:hypothetical protein